MLSMKVFTVFPDVEYLIFFPNHIVGNHQKSLVFEISIKVFAAAVVRSKCYVIKFLCLLKHTLEVWKIATIKNCL